MPDCSIRLPCWTPHQIISRADAKASGLTWYYTGKPCKHGHMSVRRVVGNDCVACSEKRCRDRYEANREQVLEHYKAYHAANRERKLAQQKAYREANREAGREYDKARYMANRERMLARAKAYRDANRERERERYKSRYEENRARYLAAWHRRRARKLAAGGTHTPADIHTLLRLQKHRCAYCRASLKRKRYHVDHIIPLALGGSNARKNLQILCPTCNLKKGAKPPEVFARECGMLV